MTANRYLNAVLTLIAVELGVIALTHTAEPVSAQQPRPTPVVITGVEVPRNVMLPITVRSVELTDRSAYLPVAVLGQETLPDTRFRPIDVRTTAPIKIEADRPLRVEADPPLKVQIPVVTSPRPGL
jgi:hypothetical protein